MKWEDIGRSRNLEDRRGRRPPARGAAVPLGIGGMLIVLVVSLLTGVDLSSILGSGPGASTGPAAAPPSARELEGEEEQVRFVSFVLDDVQEAWAGVFERSGLDYRDAQLVLYRDAVESGCGVAPAAAGPFYCPADTNVYVDLSFFDALQDRFGATGDFAQAYVLAHEIGHHVQHQLGTLAETRAAQQAQPAEANGLSVALELQADCYAGLWAASADARAILEPGDLEEGLRAAAAVGDDRLSGRAGRTANEETFTHGTSEQRMSWFRTGYERADPAACDTFSGR